MLGLPAAETSLPSTTARMPLFTHQIGHMNRTSKKPLAICAGLFFCVGVLLTGCSFESAPAETGFNPLAIPVLGIDQFHSGLATDSVPGTSAIAQSFRATQPGLDEIALQLTGFKFNDLPA